MTQFKSRSRPREARVPERHDSASVNADNADVLKTLCHLVLSEWAKRHNVLVDVDDVSTIVRDLGRKDARQLDRALDKSIAATRGSKRATATPTANEAPSNEDTPTASLPATAQVIVRAAANVFLDRGYDVNLDEIALAAGVTKPTIYTYFKGKKELFRAVMIDLADELVPKLDPPSDTGNLREDLLRYARAFRHVLLSERNLLTYRTALLHLRDDPDIGQLMGRKTMLRINTSLSQFFRVAMDRGSIRRADPEQLAELFFAATAGQSRTKRLMGLDVYGPEDEERYLQLFVDCFLDGAAGAGTQVKPSKQRGARRAGVKR